MAVEISTADVLKAKLVDSGLYDAERANELVGRISHDENAMLTVLGRLSVEAQRGGTKVQQCIRAVVKSEAIPQSLETFEKLAQHELADPSFPRVG
jgi:hypothetical protein